MRETNILNNVEPNTGTHLSIELSTASNMEVQKIDFDNDMHQQIIEYCKHFFKYLVQKDKYPTYLKDDAKSDIIFKNLLSDILEFKPKKFKFYLSDTNSIYFKIVTKTDFDLKLELFLDTEEIFFSVFDNENLIEENIDNWSDVINHLKSNPALLKNNTSEVTEYFETV